MSDRRGLSPDDLDLLATAGDVRLAPGGRRVAYVVRTPDLRANTYRSRIWLAELDGDRRPTPISAGEDPDRMPRWSPDGSMLAWVTGKERPTVVVASAAGPGAPTKVFDWSDDVSEVEWSPEGDRLAFVARVPDPDRYGPPEGPRRKEDEMPPRRVTRLFSRLNGEDWVYDRRPQVHVVPIDGTARPRALTDAVGGAWGVAWRPDGKRLAYVAAAHDTFDLDECDDVWTVEADGGEPTRLTATDRSWGPLGWSPDGACLAALGMPDTGSAPRHGRLSILDAATGEVRARAADLDRNLLPYGASRSPVWVGEEVVVPVEEHGAVHVLAVGPEQHRTLIGGEVVVRSFDIVDGTVAWVASTPSEPAELWAAELTKPQATRPTATSVRRLTDLSRTLASRVALSVPERFTATSVDGTEVECWAMAPLDAEDGKAYPTVLNVHGGPFTQYGYGFFDEFQFQTAAGFGVVFCNPRGSSGYTEAWGRAIRWPECDEDPGSGWGGVDYDDVMACVDTAVQRFGWVDGDRLGMQGGSYGGYMASWIAGHTDRFGAIVSERAVNDLLRMEHDSDCAGFFRDYVGRTHLERPDIFARQSPATYIEAMTTPLLMVHSEQDLRCPISQAEELFVALRLMGRNPELVRFPGENHEMSRSGSPVHRRMRAEIILDWFDRNLRP